MTQEAERTLTGHPGVVTHIAFSPDGMLLASSSSGPSSLKLWEVSSGREPTTLTVPPDDVVTHIAFSPDNKLLASSSKGPSSLKLWEVSSGRELTTFKVSRTVRVSYNSHKSFAQKIRDFFARFATFFSKSSVQDELNGYITFNVENEYRDRVWNLAFSPDGKRLASAGWDSYDEHGSVAWYRGAIKFWEIPTGRELSTLICHMGQGIHSTPLSGMVFSPDSMILAGTSDNHFINLWDALTGRELDILNSDWYWTKISHVAFSPDGKLLASIDDESRIMLWEISTGRQPKRLDRNDPPGHKFTPIMCLAFSPDGRFLAGGDTGGIIQFWTLPDGNHWHSLFAGVEGSIYCMAFNPRGTLLASGCGDTIKLWRVPSDETNSL